MPESFPKPRPEAEPDPVSEAEQELALQKEFDERTGTPYFVDRRERQEGGVGAAAEGAEKRTFEKIRRKIERIDEKLSAVDWAKPENRQTLDASLEVAESEQAESAAFQTVSASLAALAKEINALDKEQFELLRSRKGKMTETDYEAVEDILKAKDAAERKVKEITASPETALYARMHELLLYQEGLKTGFAETPSRKQIEDWVEEKWRDGKATLLEGATGTGKTELLKHLARKLYGRDPEIVRSTERTGPPEIFGKILLKANEAGGTETYFQPGRVLSAMDRGLPVVFDEFNQLQTNTRFQLKELYNRRPGDEVVVQEDTGKPHTIKDGFVFAGTANLKSEKHKERFELDGAESRVFSMKHVDYMPKEELYDLLLASLMGKDGSAPIGRAEAETTLKHFTDAVEEIQNGYDKTITHHYGVTDAKGTKPKLEKAVLDPGAAIEMVRNFPGSRAKGESLRVHLEKGLMDFLGKRDYPDKDRNLCARILVAKGFFKETTAKDFGIQGLDDAALAALRPRETAERKAKPKSKETLSQRDLALLDPFGLRAEAWKKIGLAFLEGAPQPAETVEGKETEEGVSLREAREILGDRFFGPEEIREAFNIEIEDVPIIPFTRERLLTAKEKDLDLVLYAGKLQDGKPLTGKGLYEYLDKKKKDGSKLLHDTGWYKDEEFFTSESPDLKWRLSGRETVPDSTSKNYLDQTKVLADYVKSLYKDEADIPPEVKEALDEFAPLSNDPQFIAAVESADAPTWKQAAETLGNLKLNQSFRESFTELFYRFVLVDKTKAEQLLPAIYSWTNSRSSVGYLVSTGGFASGGAFVDRYGPRDSASDLGVSFSATKL